MRARLKYVVVLPVWPRPSAAASCPVANCWSREVFGKQNTLRVVRVCPSDGYLCISAVHVCVMCANSEHVQYNCTLAVLAAVFARACLICTRAATVANCNVERASGTVLCVFAFVAVLMLCAALVRDDGIWPA